MTSLLQNAKTQFIDINGAPLVNGSVYMFFPGTENPKTTYQDPNGIASNTNPIKLDEYGQAIIWGIGSYRQQVFDALGNLIWDLVTQEGGATGSGNYAIETFTPGAASTPGPNGTFIAGTSTTLTLSGSYGSASNVEVFFDGVYQQHNGFGLNAFVLTFAAPIPTGVQSIEVRGGLAVSINAPAALSVNDGSVALNSKLYFAANQVTNLKYFGAKGDGITDDTIAVKAWIAATLTSGISGYAPTGRYKVSQNITIDWTTVATTGARFFGDGMSRTIFDLTAVTTAPAWLMTNSSGACFYGQFLDIGIQGNCAGPVFQVGTETFTDEFNEFIFRVEATNGASVTSACACEINGLYNSDSFIVANCAGYGEAMRIRQAQFSRFFGSWSDAQTALHITGGYTLGNTFQALDLEVVNICVLIDSPTAINNTFMGGTFVWSNATQGTAVAAITSGAGSQNRFIGVNYNSPGTIVSGSVGIIVYGPNGSVGQETLGGLAINPIANDASVAINSVASNTAYLNLQKAGVDRWHLSCDATGLFQILRFNTSGVAQTNAMTIESSLGLITIPYLVANNVGFFGAGATTTRPTVTGSKGGNAALASLLAALAGLGLITDSSS